MDIYGEKKRDALNDGRVDVLRKVRGLYEGAVGSAAYQKWLSEAKLAWNFYDGEQWSAEEVSKLAENGQPAIVINKIAAKVDNIAGTEIASRTRIMYRSRSGDEGEESTARALTDLGLYVAERSNQALEISSVFRSGLVTGIGWLDVGVENAAEGKAIFNRAENEMDVVWDPNMRRMDGSDAKFVCRVRWLDVDELKQLFPQTCGSLVGKLGQNIAGGGYAPAADSVSYFDGVSDLFRVVEVQYKKTEKLYRVSTPLGGEFVTFNRAAAYADSANSVTSEFAPRVYVACFCDDVLLSDRALGYQHNHFTLIPYIFKRHRSDGRPYGLVKTAIDPQRELNKRRSKAMHLLNTAQVVADVDAVEDPAILAREAARPDGLILKRPGKELKILRNTDLAASQVAVMEQAARDIQEVVGVFDESLGKQSNATSGIAIQTRQTAGALNQMFAFDALRRVKKQLGEMLLALVRQYFSAEMVINITDDLAAPRVVRLNRKVVDADGNEVVDADGEPVKEHDVRSGTFDVHVEEVRDVLSSRELDVAQLNMLIGAGVPLPPKMLVEATNLRNKQEIMGYLDGSNAGDEQN